MLRQLRQSIINHLWHQHYETTDQLKQIEHCLRNSYSITTLPLDHFAIIDLPGPHSGIPVLRDIFSLIGYQERGKGYLADKQNDFLWMADSDSCTALAVDALPQAVVADFRLHEMPADISRIIEKYAHQSIAFPMDTARQLLDRVNCNNGAAANELYYLITRYLHGRDWPLPTRAEFHLVNEFNELLSWVLVFGRKTNHFTLSIHLLDAFNSLDAFHTFIADKINLQLNQEGGIIKGSAERGIAQSSSIDAAQSIMLADGTVNLPASFVEFVWRFPQHQTGTTPLYWRDYFTGFVAQHANHVIESLYNK